jgi:uncharacterized Fe-S cluster protein YjdI/CDGSH-type Zn-finger protein
VTDEVAEERVRRGAARVYGDDRIQVLWEPKLCIHVQSCVRRLPEVFDAAARPWIHVEAAEADRIAETVATCPTGALHFRRLDGGAQEEADASDETRVQPRTDGPLFLRGRIRIEDSDGNLIREDTRVALCRCGGSSNKPFCDGTHRTIGFKTPPKT